MKWWLLICLAGILLACSDWQRPGQLEKVEKISDVLENLTQTLDEIGGDRLDEMISAAETLEQRVEEIGPDTLSYDLAVRLDHFHRMGLEAAAVREQVEQFRGLVEEREKCVGELKGDIEAGSGRRDRYDEFIAFEEEQSGLLQERIDACHQRWEEAVHIFDELNVILPKELDERFGTPVVQ